MTEQFDLILCLAGGEVKPRAMLPGGRGLAGSRLMKLSASAFGYVRSFVFPSMAIVGDSLTWGTGDIRLLPKIDGRTFLKEVFNGRPVIFVQRTDARPYESLTRFLNFDEYSHAQTLLNGNDCLAFSGYSQGRKVYAHVGKSNHGRDAVQRHYEGLSTARAALMHASLIKSIAEPEPLQVQGEAIAFTQSYLDGEKIDLRSISAADCSVLLRRAAQPLREIHNETYRAGHSPEARFILRMKSDLAKAGWTPSVKSNVQKIIGKVESWLEVRALGTVCVHGDFTFSNLLFDGSREVSAIVDWEWTRGSGCPGYDAMHLGLAAAYTQSGVSIPSLAASIVGGGELPEVLAKFLNETMPEFGILKSDLAPLAMLVWLGSIFRSSVWTPAPKQDWLANAVAPMFKALQ